MRRGSVEREWRLARRWCSWGGPALAVGPLVHIIQSLGLLLQIGRTQWRHLPALSRSSTGLVRRCGLALLLWHGTSLLAEGGTVARHALEKSTNLVDLGGPDTEDWLRVHHVFTVGELSDHPESLGYVSKMSKTSNKHDCPLTARK